MRILIADDHPSVRKLLRELLEAHEGWTLCGEAEDGFDAIEKAKQSKPELVVIDLVMPRMDGLLAASRISELLPRVTIILFTLHDSPQLRAEAKNHGVLEVVPKSEGLKLISTIEAVSQGTQANRLSPSLDKTEKLRGRVA